MAMAASQLYSTCLAHTRFRACRALLLLSPRRIPLSFLQIQCAPLLVSVNSFHDCRHRSSLSPSLFAPGTRCYCALNASSGSRDLNRSLSQAELELDEEISRLERQHREMTATPASTKGREQETSSVDYCAVDVSSGCRDLNRIVSHEELEVGEETSRPLRETVPNLSGSKAREQKKLILDLEGDPNVTSSESTSGGSRTKRSSKEQPLERTPLQKARLSESLNRSAGTMRKSSSLDARQVVSVDEEDDGVMGSMLEKDFSSDEDLESDAESEAEVREPNSGESSGRVQSSHPWEEWNAFLDVLHRKNYFKDMPKSALEGEGHVRFQNASYTKHAITEFGRERDDIIR